MKRLLFILLIPIFGFGQIYTLNCECEELNLTMIFSIDELSKKIIHLKTINKNVSPNLGIYNEIFEYDDLIWKDYGIFRFRVEESWNRVEFLKWDLTNNTFTSEYHKNDMTIKKTYQCF